MSNNALTYFEEEETTLPPTYLSLLIY
jgi:hypothetical protein